MTAATHVTQTDRFLEMLLAARERGVHTFEMRDDKIGNPSQRMADLRKRGFTIVVGPKERLRGPNMGVRYWLADYAPARVMPVVLEESGQYALMERAA